MEDEEGKKVDTNDEDYLKRKKARFIVNATKCYRKKQVCNDVIINDSSSNMSHQWMEYVTLIANNNIQQKKIDKNNNIEEMEKIFVSVILFKNKRKKIYGIKLLYRIIEREKTFLKTLLTNKLNDKKKKIIYY